MPSVNSSDLEKRFAILIFPPYYVRRGTIRDESVNLRPRIRVDITTIEFAMEIITLDIVIPLLLFLPFLRS